MNMKIAYIGGGSKEWAKVFMNDLALTPGLEGEIALYDIDHQAAERNQRIGTLIGAHAASLSHFVYTVAQTIEAALNSADFVAISILPGELETMAVDVHAPEKYGIYQSVGDTVGPGGVIRSLRTVPLFEHFAKKIRECCPEAWVLNFTNPMTICVKTLYDVFPEIKAFGCCHEVFHAQDFLCRIWEAQIGEKINRREIFTDVSGVNHFTWITRATYKNHDLMRVLAAFVELHHDSGFNHNGATDAYLSDPFACANMVKMDLFRRYGALGAAGDRHLAEFMPRSSYLRSPASADRWRFALTPVAFRIREREKKRSYLEAVASGKLPVKLQKSDEEAIEMMLALRGGRPLVANVNIPNRGQMPGIPLGAIVETNAVFTNDHVIPIDRKSVV